MPSRSRAVADAVGALAKTFPTEQVGHLLEVMLPRKKPGIKLEDSACRVWIYPLTLSIERDKRMVMRRPSIAVLFDAPIDETRTLDYWEGVAEKYMDQFEALEEEIAGFRVVGVESDTLWDPETADNGRFASMYQLVFAESVFV